MHAWLRRTHLDEKCAFWWSAARTALELAARTALALELLARAALSFGLFALPPVRLARWLVASL